MAVIGLGVGAAQAVHPGTAGGLTFPRPDWIVVDDETAGTYRLDIAGADDVAWSPAGRFLAYTVPDGDAPGLYVTDGAGCVTDRLTTNGADRAPAFDGAKLYFTRGGETLTFDYDLFGEAWSRSAAPSPSALGTDVAVSVIEGRWASVFLPGTEDPDEYVLRVDDLFAGTSTPVHTSPEPIRGVEWSPDGSLLAFESTVTDGSVEIHLADLAEEPPTVSVLTMQNGDSRDPAFSPDGAFLAFQHWGPGQTSGVVRLIELGIGGSTVVAQGATGGLDWQSLNPPPTALRPIETEVSLAFDSSPTAGANDLTITMSPAPPAGSQLTVSVDGTEVAFPETDASGVTEATIVLETGDHDVVAAYEGSCPWVGATDTVGVTVSSTPPPTPSPTASPAPIQVGRISGPDRYATAAAVSRARHPRPAADVEAFVVTGGNFPDALAAGPAAGLRDAPILLVQPGSIPAATRTELARLGPARIHVVGGPSVVSESVRTQLRQYTDSGASSSVPRLSGDNRYGTAEAVSRLFAANRPSVLVATGAGFPDALAAGPAATRLGVPILLVERDRIPAETAAALRRLTPARIHVIGGAAVISEAVRVRLARFTDSGDASSVRRHAGADRFATNVAVTRAFWTSSVARTVVANGFNFPDALSHGAYGMPLHLVGANSLPAIVARDIRRLDPARIDVLGGTQSVSNGVVGQLKAL